LAKGSPGAEAVVAAAAEVAVGLVAGVAAAGSVAAHLPEASPEEGDRLLRPDLLLGGAVRRTGVAPPPTGGLRSAPPAAGRLGGELRPSPAHVQGWPPGLAGREPHDPELVRQRDQQSPAAQPPERDRVRCQGWEPVVARRICRKRVKPASRVCRIAWRVATG
jgi:hypothetical protein